MPWAKSKGDQLDLLDSVPAAELHATPSTSPPSSTAGQALFVATSVLYEDAANPRTELPEGELAELTPKGGQIVGGTLNEQLVLTEQNLRFALSSLDADVQDIMRMNVFVKNFQQNQDLPVLEPFLFRMGSPVDAVLGVTSLAIDGLLVEVQMTVAVKQATVDRIRCTRKG